MLFGVKVPLPDEVQLIPLAILTVPFKVTFALLAQTVWLEPALTVGEGVTVIVIWSVTATQAPLFKEERVSVISPAVISAILGVYIAVSAVLLGANAPVPLELHCPEPVLDVPLRTTFELFAQTV